MSATLTLARPDHLAQLLPLVAAFHADAGISGDDKTREAALRPLLDGSPHGAVYLIGPARAPIGYIALGFGWSIRSGGLDGRIDELFVRAGVRGRGIASEVLRSLPKALAGAGLKALHVELHAPDEMRLRLFSRAGFSRQADDHLLVRRF